MCAPPLVRTLRDGMRRGFFEEPRPYAGTTRIRFKGSGALAVSAWWGSPRVARNVGLHGGEVKSPDYRCACRDFSRRSCERGFQRGVHAPLPAGAGRSVGGDDVAIDAQADELLRRRLLLAARALDAGGEFGKHLGEGFGLRELFVRRLMRIADFVPILFGVPRPGVNSLSLRGMLALLLLAGRIEITDTASRPRNAKTTVINEPSRRRTARKRPRLVGMVTARSKNSGESAAKSSPCLSRLETRFRSSQVMTIAPTTSNCRGEVNFIVDTKNACRRPRLDARTSPALTPATPPSGTARSASPTPPARRR